MSKLRYKITVYAVILELALIRGEPRGFLYSQNKRRNITPTKNLKPLSKTDVHYSYYGKCASLLLDTALRPPQTLLAKILDT